MTATAAPVAGACPYCGEPRGERFALAHPLIADRPVDRCARCSGRFTIDSGAVARVATCGSCSLVFLRDGIGDEPARCGDCEGGRSPAALVDRAVAGAGENALRASLEARWRLMTQPGLDGYLTGLARRLAREMPGVSQTPSVVLFDDDEARSLALPSGVLLISVGLLDSLADEAELAFVIAHELVHAHEDADRGLVRLGTWRSAMSGETSPWAAAADDILALGYGDDRERIADGRALEAIRLAGYDTEAGVRWLERIGGLWDAGDARVRELCMAHPSPSDRVRRLRGLGVRSSMSIPARLNREVFRRATGPEVRAALVRREALPVGRAVTPRRRRRFGWKHALAALVVLGLVMAVWALVLA